MEPTLSGSHGPWRHLKSFLRENFSLTTLRTVFEKDQYFRASWQMATRNFNWFKICETKKHPTLYCIMVYCFCCTQLRECIVLHCIALYCSILLWHSCCPTHEKMHCLTQYSFFAVACIAILVDCSVLRLCICCPRNYIMHFKCINLQNALYHSISSTVASTYSHLGVRSERWKEGLPHCQKA